MDQTPLDGNAAAGMLGDIFSAEMTLAVITCAGCGASHAIGQLPAFLTAPGLVVRCAGCGIAQLRMVRAPDRAWVDLRGVRTLEVRLGPGAHLA
jgi:hypothetical protein